jgi:hypothetical protein
VVLLGMSREILIIKLYNGSLMGLQRLFCQVMRQRVSVLRMIPAIIPQSLLRLHVRRFLRLG